MTSRYDEALAFWYGRINYEITQPGPDDLRLDRMRELLRRLGNPHERLRIVHVAGSKGKGSTAAMLAAILGQAGYRTGLFTSPHLCRVEERFQVNSVPISPEELATALLDVEAASRQGGGSPLLPTFFEVATAVGFLHFLRRRTDITVLEVGLGGRFDSTNVCSPLLSIITSISFDHTRQLGNRLASIAGEKAGIVKPGRPVVSGATVPEAAEVIERICRERCAPLSLLGRDFSFTSKPGVVTSFSDRRLRVQVKTRDQAWPVLEVGLLGEHQAANAAVAIRGVELLRRQGLEIPDVSVRQGLANVQWAARLEVLGRCPLVVLDCAHNVASVQALVDTLHVSFPPGRRLLVLACSTDKDLPGMARVLGPHFHHAFLTRFHSNPRSAPPEQLAELFAESSNLPTTICPTAAEAWAAAWQAARPEDLICVTGSVFLAGELRPAILASCESPSLLGNRKTAQS